MSLQTCVFCTLCRWDFQQWVREELWDTFTTCSIINGKEARCPHSRGHFQHREPASGFHDLSALLLLVSFLETLKDARILLLVITMTENSYMVDHLCKHSLIQGIWLFAITDWLPVYLVNYWLTNVTMCEDCYIALWQSGWQLTFVPMLVCVLGTYHTHVCWRLKGKTGSEP